MKRILLIFLFLIGASALAGDLPDTVSEGLVLEARVDKTTFRVGEAIKVTVVMRNESDTPLLVITNFGWEMSEPTFFDRDGFVFPDPKPGDTDWRFVEFLTPFCEQYKQDHNFPRTMKIFARKYPCDTQRFDYVDFWLEHLTCLEPGSEAEAWYYYRVTALPKGLSEGNYDVRFRYKVDEWLLYWFKPYHQRIFEDDRLSSCFDSSFEDGTMEFSQMRLPLVRGLILSNTLKLKVIRPDKSH